MYTHIKQLLILFIVSFLFLNARAQKEVFLEKIEFKLENVRDVEEENEYFTIIKFSSGTKYLFKITNHVDNYPGEAVLKVLDGDTQIISNDLTDGYFEEIQFICNKTGFYDIEIEYKDNKTGYSVIDIMMLQ